MKRSYYLVVLCIATISNLCFASDYPQTIEEKRSEEIGSLLGGDGVVFRPTKVRNNSTRTDDSSVNSYLWQATKDIVEDIAPIAIEDKASGEISTQWYSDKSHPNRSMKIKVNIVDDIISPASIKMAVNQRVLKNGSWLEDSAHSKERADIEDKILRRARQLYLRKSSK